MALRDRHWEFPEVLLAFRIFIEFRFAPVLVFYAMDLIRLGRVAGCMPITCS